jgi:hypothetical protein
MSDIVCDKCKATIASSARFCPNCGDPVTDADRPAGEAPVGTERVRLVCPKCEIQDLYQLDLTSKQTNVTCAKCHSGFLTRVVVVRAKRSNSSQREGRRRFSIRVQEFLGNEELIEFINAGTNDFELRARDIAAFSYFGGELRVVQNLNVNRYMTVSKPACYLASCAYGPLAPEVDLLRRFRDQYLLPGKCGRIIVSAYYRLSPQVAARCGHVQSFRCGTRMLLWPLLVLIRRTMLG